MVVDGQPLLGNGRHRLRQDETCLMGSERSQSAISPSMRFF
jgi:hypothetical protein